MRHFSILCLFLLGLLCGACTPEEKTILATAWETVEKEPQKVIDLLDTCSFSRSSLRAQRAWLLSRAYDKCDVNIADDSLIMQAVKYYKCTRNEKMYLRSLYCLGRVQLNAGDPDNALMSFEQAADLARKQQDWFWLGLSSRNMAYIYNDAYCFGAMVKCEEESVSAFTRSGDSLYLAYEQLILARAYSSNDQDTERDSLLTFLLSQPYKDSILVGEIHRTQARVYFIRRDPLYQEAYQHYMLCPRKIMKTSDWCNMLVILSGIGKAKDPYTLSLLNQISNIALQSDDRSNALAKLALYRYHKLAGDYKAALPYFEKVMAYEDSLLREKIQQSLVFNQKEYYKRKSEREQDLRHAITAFSILATLLLLAGILLLVQRTREKRKQMEMAMSQIDEIQKKYDRLSQDAFQKEIETLAQLAKEYYEGEDQHRQHAILNHFSNQLKSFREFNEELSFLEKDVNLYKNQAMALFRQEFPGMSKHSYKMATVFFAGLPNALIGLLMNKTTPTIRTERSQLKKAVSLSDAPHKDLFLQLIENYPRDNRKSN